MNEYDKDIIARLRVQLAWLKVLALFLGLATLLMGARLWRLTIQPNYKWWSE